MYENLRGSLESTVRPTDQAYMGVDICLVNPDKCKSYWAWTRFKPMYSTNWTIKHTGSWLTFRPQSEKHPTRDISRIGVFKYSDLSTPIYLSLVRDSGCHGRVKLKRTRDEMLFPSLHVKGILSKNPTSDLIQFTSRMFKLSDQRENMVPCIS